MSAPESTTERSELDTSSRERQDSLTRSIGKRLAVPPTDGKKPWWRRVLRRS